MRNTTLQVGEIVNTHGLRGEVKIVPWLDVPEDFERLKTVYADIAGKKEIFTVASVKYQKANIIVKFKEVPDIDVAEKLKRTVLYVDRDQLGEPEEGYYICGKEVLLPVIDDVVLSVDIDAEVCKVHLLEGLI